MAGAAVQQQRQISYGAGQNLQGSNALQRSLLGYLSTGTPTQFSAGGQMGNPFSGQFPGGMTLADMGFTGEVVPSAGPMLEQAFNQAQNFQTSPEYMQRQQALGQLMGGQQSFNADPALRERFFQQSISDPAMQQFNQEMLPAIAARFGRGGNLGAAQWAGSQAAGTLAGNLAGQRAGLLRGDEQMAAASRDAAMQRMLQGAQMSMQNQQQGLGMLGQYGAAERAIRGEQNQQRLQEAYMSQPFGDPRTGMLSLLGQGGVVQPGQVNAPNAGGANAGLGALGSLLAGPMVGNGALGTILNPVGAIMGGIFG